MQANPSYYNNNNVVLIGHLCLKFVCQWGLKEIAAAQPIHQLCIFIIVKMYFICTISIFKSMNKTLSM